VSALRLKIHPSGISERHLERAIHILAQGGIVAYPTDTAYGIGCDIYAKRAIERIYAIKHMNRKKPLSFVCADLSDIARYASIDNIQYRVLRQHLPGPYTFILPATKEVPKLMASKTRTVGIRVPDHPICMALVKKLEHPIVSTTASIYAPKALARQEEDEDHEHAHELNIQVHHDLSSEDVLTDPDDIESKLGHAIDLILDVGPIPFSLSTIVDMHVLPPRLLRQGLGSFV